MVALRDIRGVTRLLRQGLRCSRLCCFEKQPEKLSLASAMRMSSSMFRSDRMSTRYSPALLGTCCRRPTPAAVLVSFRHVNSSERSLRTPDDEYLSDPILGERMVACAAQTLSPIEANITHRGEEKSLGTFVQLAGHVPMANVPNGRRRGTMVNLPASKWSGIGERALHRDICTRLGGVALFATGPRRGGILPPGMKEKNTGIKAADGEKTGIKAVDGEDDSGIKENVTGKEAGEDAVLGDMDALRGMSTLERLKYIKDKVALLYKRYFWVAFGTYWAIYISGFGIIYGALVTGLVDPGVDTATAIATLADFLGLEGNETVSGYVQWAQDLALSNPEAEKAIMAFIGSEMLELPRELSVLLLTVPIARALGKAPPKKR